MTNKKTILIRIYGYIQFELITKDNNNDFLPILVWHFIDWKYKSNEEPAKYITLISNNDNNVIYQDAFVDFIDDLTNGRLIYQNAIPKNEFLYKTYPTDNIKLEHLFTLENSKILEFINNSNYDISQKYNQLIVELRMLDIDKILNDFSID